MRLWMVDPKVMCRQHLLGEHNECHAFVGTLNKGKSVQGYLSQNLLQIELISIRHNELANEMVRRGYNHKSPLPLLLEWYNEGGFVNPEVSLKELLRRCSRCKERYDNKTN